MSGPTDGWLALGLAGASLGLVLIQQRGHCLTRLGQVFPNDAEARLDVSVV